MKLFCSLVVRYAITFLQIVGFSSTCSTFLNFLVEEKCWATCNTTKLRSWRSQKCLWLLNVWTLRSWCLPIQLSQSINSDCLTAQLMNWFLLLSDREWELIRNFRQKAATADSFGPLIRILLWLICQDNWDLCFSLRWNIVWISLLICQHRFLSNYNVADRTHLFHRVFFVTVEFWLHHAAIEFRGICDIFRWSSSYKRIRLPIHLIAVQHSSSFVISVEVCRVSSLVVL